MGSGHFLVNAAYHIASKIYSFIHKYIDFEVLVEEKMYEFSYWLRKVVTHNIYGIDINNLAVQLGKLSLWLISASKDKPLSFLDHHLKCGNSLLGTTRKEIDETLGDNLDITKSNNRTLFDITIDNLMSNIDLKLKEFEKMTENTANEIHNKEKFYYEEIQKELENVKKKWDIYLIMKLNSKDGIIKKEEYDKIVNLSSEELDKILLNLKKEKNNQFFHWELEFPNLFKNGKKGFEIIIGNPPYIQLQKLKDENIIELGKKGFQVFSKSADIYCLFYEKSINLIANGGKIAYITSNKWLRASYGKELRNYLLENINLLELIDLGEGVFNAATVDTNILIMQKNQKDSRECLGYSLKENNVKLQEIKKYLFPIKLKKNESWVIMDKILENIRDKVFSKGKALNLWKIKINRGILTGLNSAFFIEEEKKNNFIKENIKNEEILKPILKGKNIKKYCSNFENIWLITSHNGYDDIPRVNIEEYKEIKEWLDGFYDKLEKRTDKGDTPYNLRSCSYFSDFMKEKIIYPETTQGAYFYYDSKGEYIVDKTNFILTGEKLLYLLALLSSKLVTYVYKELCGGVILGSKGYQYNKHAIEKLPIYYPNSDEEKKVIFIIEKIIEMKKEKKESEELEKALDKLIYNFYELTEEEIKYIENYNV